VEIKSVGLRAAGLRGKSGAAMARGLLQPPQQPQPQSQQQPQQQQPPRLLPDREGGRREGRLYVDILAARGSGREN
jgi:hypothetical protein